MTTSTCDGAQIGEDLYVVSVPNLVGPSGQPTNVYIAGRQRAVLIDAGSDDGGAAVLNGLKRFDIQSVDKIVLTHAHQDHAGSATAVRQATGASIHLHPRDLGGPNHWTIDLEAAQPLRGGDTLETGPYRFEVIETPGHAPGHVSLYEPTLKALFAGDLISGNGTIAVVPPLGSMSEYMASLHRVSELKIDVIYPGHGPAIPNGNERVVQYIERRESREEEIHDAVASGLGDIDAITDLLYPDVLPRYRRGAAGTVFAHLIHLIEQGRIRHEGDEEVSMESRFAGSG